MRVSRLPQNASELGICHMCTSQACDIDEVRFHFGESRVRTSKSTTLSFFDGVRFVLALFMSSDVSSWLWSKIRTATNIALKERDLQQHKLAAVRRRAESKMSFLHYTDVLSICRIRTRAETERTQNAEADLQ